MNDIREILQNNMKKTEIIIIIILSIISLAITVYLYVTLFPNPKSTNIQKKQIDFPSPITEESVSKPSTFLGNIFSKNTPTNTPIPTPIPGPKTAQEYMRILEKSYSDGGKATLNTIKTEATSL